MKLFAYLLLAMMLGFYNSNLNATQTEENISDQEQLEEETMEEEMMEEPMEEEETEPEEEEEEIEQEEMTGGEEDIEVTSQVDQTGVMIDAPPSEDENMKYYKEKFEKTYTEYPFEDIYNAIKKAIESDGCQVMNEKTSQTDEGLFKGVIKSDFCIFSQGNDTTVANLKKYSIRVPIIRGGVWVVGRFQYKFVLKEKEDGSIHMLLKGEMSGFEEYVTGKMHFWDSNGYRETMILRRIKHHLEKGDF